MKHFFFIVVAVCTLCSCTDSPKPVKTSVASTSKSNLVAFNDVETLRVGISQLGYQVGIWKDDGQGWISSTPYASFGTPNPQTTLQSNLAVYLTSPQKGFVEQMKIILNLNNRAERKPSVELFQEHAKALMERCGIAWPTELSAAIKKFGQYEKQLDNCTVSFKTFKGPNTDEYTLSVKAPYQ